MSRMALCRGCGFHVEPEDVRKRDEEDGVDCSRCAICTKTPRLRESYRRGFNAGLDAMKAAVIHVAENSNLRKPAADWSTDDG